MPRLSFEIVTNYRQTTFRLRPGTRVHTPDEAAQFVNERGFIYFWPIRGITFPSLWTAVAGDRPVADAHDDPGHITWSWKDSHLGGHSWYYAKVLRKKATLISMDLVPYFYALTANYGSPEEDHLTLYEQGKLTQEAKAVYEAVLDAGPLDTVALRRAAHLSSRENETRFNRALSDLQVDFKLVPMAVTQAGSWHYAFAYDIVARHYPEIAEKARWIGEREARRTLVEYYFRTLGAAPFNEVRKIFQWKPGEVQQALDDLVNSRKLLSDLEFEKYPGKWFVLANLG